MVGPCVEMVSVTVVAFVVAFGLKLHWAASGRPVQEYDTGRTVDEFPPVVTTNPFELVTVRSTGLLVWPCRTANVPPDMLLLRLKVSDVPSSACASPKLGAA
jgi:hypothetical protein